MITNRRSVMKSAGFGLVAAVIGGVPQMIAAAEAHRRTLAFKVLSPGQAATFAALGETLLPGSRDAGIAHFVDDQLAKDPADCLLILRYFDWPPPYTPFYAGGIAALDGAAQVAHGKPFGGLGEADRVALVGRLLGGDVAGWQGPPAPLFYLSARSDAVDVVYGTIEGAAKLGLPYMAHIEPDARW